MTRQRFLTSLCAAALTGGAAQAQKTQDKKKNDKAESPKPEDTPPLTLDARDAPLRLVLEMLFRAANAQYSLGAGVGGPVSLSLTQQPFLPALSFVCRAASPPATFRRENGVFVVSPRPGAPALAPTGTPPVETARPALWRLSATLLAGAAALAVLERGDTGGSEIVSPGSRLIVGGALYTVAALTPARLSLHPFPNPLDVHVSGKNVAARRRDHPITSGRPLEVFLSALPRNPAR